MRMRGTIFELVRAKGFGFVQVDGRRPVFFHQSMIRGGRFEALWVNQVVWVTLEPAESSPRGPRARSVEVLLVEEAQL